MPSSVVRWGTRALLVSAFLLATATPSLAPHVAQLQVAPAEVRAGQEVTVFGPRGYGRSNPVEIRGGAVDGPVLGTFQPNEELYAMWGPGAVRIPENVKAGTYYLFATQTLAANETHIRGVPARGEVKVLGATGTAPVLGQAPETPLSEQPRVELLEEEPVSTGTILLVALGVAGAGLFLAGGAAALSTRRQSAQPAPQKK
ncbi:MAG TPA: hypothetical protein VJ653_01380 [Acidimicrobiales bacterium]|nr:hypothetical protein [Acidimicrobiales bacterium]